MPRQFTLPDLGEGVKEGQVLRLFVREGEAVKEDQLLMEVETDKAAVEIPSPYTGLVTQLHVAETQVVNVGDLMVTFDDGEGKPTKSAVPTTVAATPAASAVSGSSRRPSGPPPGQPAGRRTPASPAVRKLARERGVDLGRIHGSGPGGRVLRSDVEAAATGEAASVTAVPSPSPVARPARLAAPRTAPRSAPVAAPEGEGRDDTDAYGPVRRSPLTQTRKAIASVMAEAARTIPHVTDTEEADVTELDRLRRGYNDGVEGGQRLGMLAFVIRAVTRALVRHPLFNASLDEAAGEIVYKRYYNVAVGVHTPRGLVAPVLRDVDRLTIPEINARLVELAERARTGSFALDATRGATYTISNAGAMGGSWFSTPIITPPQVAVLAIGRSRPRAWVVDGEIVPRLIMPLSHSMDHRLIDGAVEIAFIRDIVGDLEHPARLML